MRMSIHRITGMTMDSIEPNRDRNGEVFYHTRLTFSSKTWDGQEIVEEIDLYSESAEALVINGPTQEDYESLKEDFERVCDELASLRAELETQE